MNKKVLFFLSILIILMNLTVIAILTQSNILFSSNRFPGKTFHFSKMPRSSNNATHQIQESVNRVGESINFLHNKSMIGLSEAVEIAEGEVQGIAFEASLIRGKSKGGYIYRIELIKETEVGEYLIVEIDVDASSGEVIRR
jgi:hypothetical protein